VSLSVAELLCRCYAILGQGTREALSPPCLTTLIRGDRDAACFVYTASLTAH
jgi:hypothetical protein